MKKIVWRDGDHMLFESGHKTFDQQVDIISTGNIIGAVQLSKYIRPYSETSCGFHDREPGFFRDHDLGWWHGVVDIPSEVRSLIYLMTETGDDSIILYEFHHYSRGRRVTHGYVVTTKDHRLLGAFVTGPTHKSKLVIEEAIKYVTMEEA